MRRTAIPAASLSLVIFAAAARADDGAQYRFKGGPAYYEVTINAENPASTDTKLGYLALRPVPGAADGQVTLTVDWAVRTSRQQVGGVTTESGGGVPGMFATKPDGFLHGKLVIDASGKPVSHDGVGNDAQLEHSIGPVWEVLLPPLPQPGQTTWQTQRPVVIYENTTADVPGGMWGHHQETTRVERGAEQTITYTAAGPAQGGKLTVQAKTDLVSELKTGDTPLEHLTGDGQFVFDTGRGLVQSLAYKYVDALAQKNVSVRVPVSVSARLLGGDEVAKLTADADAQQARSAADQERDRLEHRNDVQEVPDGMAESDMAGSTTGGGPFVKVDPDHRPLIGLVLEEGGWGGEKRFRRIDPLYEPPDKARREQGQTVVVARDGYAVGAVTVNAGESVNAVCVTFMKKTPTGLDTKTLYNSPWYGKALGPSRKRLWAKGQTVYGLFGRKGLNVDALGVVYETTPSAASDNKLPPADEDKAPRPTK